MPPRSGFSERAATASALLTVQVLFGVHYLAAKVLLGDIPPRAWAALRITAAAVVLWGAVVAFARRLPDDPKDVLRLGVYALFGVVINQVLFVEGLARTTPVHSAIINTTIPVLTLLFAVLLGHETLSFAKGASFALAIAGVMLVLRPDRASFSQATFVGDILTLLNAASFALFLVLSKRVLARIDPLAATAVLFAFGTVGVLLVGGAPLARLDWSSVPIATWGLGAFIVLGPTVGAYLLNYWALARTDSSVVALFIYVQPLVAVGLSMLLGGDDPSRETMIGGGLIAAGVAIAILRRTKR